MMDCLLISPAVARARLVARRTMEVLMMVTVSSWTSDSLRNVQMFQSLQCDDVCLSVGLGCNWFPCPRLSVTAHARNRPLRTTLGLARSGARNTLYLPVRP